ncbi:MAG: UDP-N-acetylglucosamine pyrophosphorylase [Eubacteriales bacterium]
MDFHGLFSYERSILGAEIAKEKYPWDILPKLKALISELGTALPESEYDKIGDDVWVSKSATVVPSASITGPCIICAGAEVRHCAYIRGSVIVGEGTVVGNSTEIKNAVLFDKVQVPHYNYIGDSILGVGAHFGAGAVTSNVKGNKTNVNVHDKDGDIATGLRKFGALVGDGGEIGCGCVLNPGTVIGKNTQIYPLCSVRGVIGDGKICKSADNIVNKEI